MYVHPAVCSFGITCVMFTLGPRADPTRVVELLLMFIVAPHSEQVHLADELPRASLTGSNGDFIWTPVIPLRH